MAILKNASGKLFTIGGKLVILGTSSSAGLNIYDMQTLQLPSGDQVDALVADSNDEVMITADMDLAFVWEYDTGSQSTFYQWGGSIEAPYIYATNGEGDHQRLHIFEFEGYAYLQEMESLSTPEARAEFLCHTGRYLGTVSIDSNDCWVVEYCYNDLP